MAMMPDAALKQMAMMHKNDPYTLPLIIAEDSRRKEMRQAAQARMAAPQPNVADQQIAQMGAAPQMPMPQGAPQGAPQQLPEHQGIGALPAQNLERMADGGIAGYDGDDESLVHLSPFAMKQIMGDMVTSGAGVNANADLGEAGRLSGGVNLNRMDKDRESRQMQALMANYMNNIGEVGINANVSRPLERDLPSDFYQTNLMGSVPVGEGRLTIGKHGTHARGEHHTNAHSIGYNTPFEGGRLNANINKPVEGRPSFGVQYNRAFADGGIAGYADGGQQPGMFNYAQMAPAVDLHPDSGVTPRSMASGGTASFGVGGNVTSTDGGKTWSIDVPYSTPRNPVPPALKALAGQTFSSAKEAEAALAAASGETYVPSKLFTSAAATPTVTNPNVKSTGHDFDAVSTTQTTPPKPQPNLSNSGLGSLVAQTPLPAAISPEKATQMAGKFVDDSDLRAQLADAQQQQLVSNAYLKDRAEELRPKGVAYSELEKQLQKEEADTAGQKNEATGMALLKAGLSIAAGGSPFALQNIGQGALAGVADYQDAMKDMKKMARERMKMSADIEQARRAESRDDYKTQMAFEEKAQDRADKLTEKGIDVTAKIFGVKTDVAKDIWATTFKETEATKRSNTAANASANAQLNLFTALGNAPEGSALRKGFALSHPQDRPETAFAQMYARHLEESRKNMTEPLSPTQFAATIRGAISAFKPQVVDTDNPNPSAKMYGR